MARDAVLLVAEKLLDGREVHQRGGVVGLENVFVDQRAVQRAEIDAVEGEFRELRDAERLIGRLLPEKIAHAALTR